MCVTGVYTNTNRLKYRKGSRGLAIEYHDTTFTNSVQRAQTHRAIHWGKQRRVHRIIRMAMHLYACVCAKLLRQFEITTYTRPKGDGCLPMCLESKASLVVPHNQRSVVPAAAGEPCRAHVIWKMWFSLYYTTESYLNQLAFGVSFITRGHLCWMEWMLCANSNFIQRSSLETEYPECTLLTNAEWWQICASMHRTRLCASYKHIAVHHFTSHCIIFAHCFLPLFRFIKWKHLICADAIFRYTLFAAIYYARTAHFSLFGHILCLGTWMTVFGVCTGSNYKQRQWRGGQKTNIWSPSKRLSHGLEHWNLTFSSIVFTKI